MNTEEITSSNLWFEGSVAAAVEIANTKGSVLLVCLVQNPEEDGESAQFESRFMEEKVVNELSEQDLISLRLVRNSVDGVMFSQIFPVMAVPALYLIRNGLLTDYMNNTVDVDQMLERIKKAVDGHFQIPPPPNITVSGDSVVPANTSSHSSEITQSHTGVSLSASASSSMSPQTTIDSPATNAATSSVTPNIAGASTPNRSQDLKELMKERKLKREKEEREAEKQREIGRRSSSKTLSETQRELSEKQSKKLKDQIEKDKREEVEYKKRVKQALEEDRARRKAEKEAAQAAAATSGSPHSDRVLTPGEIRSQNAGLEKARNDAGPALAYDSSRLNIRLFDGTSIRNTFKATDTLEKVRNWIDQNLQESEDAYNIVQLIPSRTFTDESKMLRDLELCPSATLVLKKTATTSSAYGTSGDGAVPTILGYGWSALSLAGKVASSAYSTVSYYNPLASGGSAGSNDHTTRGNHDPSAASSKKKDSEISYNGNSTNLE
ncbi:hypothetical protein BGX27_002736 [Mortierella sp. AM989]|nr:hypothetical protein BGX27_002736 [Mortierella sp. AM989]